MGWTQDGLASSFGFSTGWAAMCANGIFGAQGAPFDLTSLSTHDLPPNHMVELVNRHGWWETATRLIHPAHEVFVEGEKLGYPLPVQSCGGGATLYTLPAITSGHCRYDIRKVGDPSADVSREWAVAHAEFHRW
eukprot:SAG31_NODE_2500_length_5595_cov_4.571143_4_plen_134_part_00